MQTLAVHAHMLSITERNAVAGPNRWDHDLVEGSLTYSFTGSPNTFTWRGPAIASITETLDDEPLTPRAQELLDRWEAISSLLDEAGQNPPDKVFVDHDADEMRLIWHDPPRVVIIGPDGPDESPDQVR